MELCARFNLLLVLFEVLPVSKTVRWQVSGLVTLAVFLAAASIVGVRNRLARRWEEDGSDETFWLAPRKSPKERRSSLRLVSDDNDPRDA